MHKGGTLGLSAFKAGPGAEANDQLDKLSLMLIKGIRDVLTQRTTVWHIADAGQDNVDFVLDGYIEELSQSGKFSRLILRKNKTNLSVDGEIWSQATGGKVLVFASSEIINIKKQELMDQAYAMGQAIGEFIAAQAKE